VEQQESTGDTSDCVFCPCSPHLTTCGKYDPSPVIEWLSEPGGCPDCLDVWGLYGCPRCPCSYEMTCSGAGSFTMPCPGQQDDVPYSRNGARKGLSGRPGIIPPLKYEWPGRAEVTQ